MSKLTPQIYAHHTSFVLHRHHETVFTLLARAICQEADALYDVDKDRAADLNEPHRAAADRVFSVLLGKPNASVHKHSAPTMKILKQALAQEVAAYISAAEETTSEDPRIAAADRLMDTAMDYID